MIFHGVNGVDEREGSSPSFFNVTEVEVLMDYVEKLLQKQAKKVQPAVSPCDIGIIAPYRKQVRINSVQHTLQQVIVLQMTLVQSNTSRRGNM